MPTGKATTQIKSSEASEMTKVSPIRSQIRSLTGTCQVSDWPKSPRAHARYPLHVLNVDRLVQPVLLFERVDQGLIDQLALALQAVMM